MMLIPNKLQYQKNVANLCVDEWRENDIQGRLYHCCQLKPYPIVQVIDIFEILEQFYDKINYPQATARTRKFEEKSCVYEKVNIQMENDIEEKKEIEKNRERILEERGKKATFLLGVDSRCNANWQGELYWIEEEVLWQFSSDMELLALLDYAVGIKNVKK